MEFCTHPKVTSFLTSFSLTWTLLTSDARFNMSFASRFVLTLHSKFCSDIHWYCSLSSFGLKPASTTTQRFGNQNQNAGLGQSSILASSTLGQGSPQFTKSTRFNDLPDDVKKTLEEIELVITFDSWFDFISHKWAAHISRAAYKFLKIYNKEN